jgi:gluconokinase
MRPGAVVIMGVAGSGKSTLGLAVAQRTGWPMIEGDDFHSDENKARMANGLPLRDADREAWLRDLVGELQQRKGGAVLACSALKRKYRDMLRAASADLAFVFLEITPEEALRRVRLRSQHFFPPNLLQSQFETLESPVDEPRVLWLDARLPLEILTGQTAQWLLGNGGNGA